MYEAKAVSVATRLQTVHATRARLYITHAQKVTPITNTPNNTTGLFLAHVKTTPPRESAILGSLAFDDVYQSTVDGIHQTPLSHMRRQTHPSMLCCTQSNDTHRSLLTQGVNSTSMNRAWIHKASTHTHTTNTMVPKVRISLSQSYVALLSSGGQSFYSTTIAIAVG